jgi:hypothetical protein
MNRRIRIHANHTWATQIAEAARRILREAIAEIARLNRAGLDTNTLVGKSRRDRAQSVAAALSYRHGDVNRCC